MQPSTPELDRLIAQADEVRTTLQGITEAHPLHYPLSRELDTLEAQVAEAKEELKKSHS